MKVLIIDLDDTLIEDVDAARASVVQTLSAVDLPTDDETTEVALRFIRKMWKAHPHRLAGPLAHVSGWEALWLPRESTGLPDPIVESLRLHEIQVWRAIIDWCRGNPGKASTAAQAYRSFRHERIRPLPGTRAALEILRRNHRLWLATNGLPAHQHRKLSEATLNGFFDRILISGEVGAAKSHPVFASVIRQALTRDGLRVCLVIGDSATQDLQLASNGGWAAAHICLPGPCEATVAASETAPVTHIPSLSHVACECPPPPPPGTQPS